MKVNNFFPSNKMYVKWEVMKNPNKYEKAKQLFNNENGLEIITKNLNNNQIINLAKALTEFKQQMSIGYMSKAGIQRQAQRFEDLAWAVFETMKKNCKI